MLRDRRTGAGEHAGAAPVRLWPPVTLAKVQDGGLRAAVSEKRSACGSREPSGDCSDFCGGCCSTSKGPGQEQMIPLLSSFVKCCGYDEREEHMPVLEVTRIHLFHVKVVMVGCLDSFRACGLRFMRTHVPCIKLPAKFVSALINFYRSCPLCLGWRRLCSANGCTRSFFVRTNLYLPGAVVVSYGVLSCFVEKRMTMFVSQPARSYSGRK